MAKDLNKVMATGRLGKDPEMKYTPEGKAVTTFSVASGRSYKKADGTQEDSTEWVNCVAWDRLAEICNQYLAKGSKVYIEGRLSTRSWDDKDTGQKRYRTEVVLSDMIMLGERGAQSSEGEGDEGEPAPVRPATSAPQGRAPQPPQRQGAPVPSRGPAPAPATRAPARNVPQSIESDEDLPF